MKSMIILLLASAAALADQNEGTISKRDADPQGILPVGGPAIAYHPWGGTSWVGNRVHGHWIGKRSAHGLGYYNLPAIALHPGAGHSYVGNRAHGLNYGLHHLYKRSANPSGVFHGHPAIASHPFHGHSYVLDAAHDHTGHGHIGHHGHHHVKRSAEPHGIGHGLGVAGHPYGGISYVGPRAHGLNYFHHIYKRSPQQFGFPFNNFNNFNNNGIALHPDGFSHIGNTVHGFGKRDVSQKHSISKRHVGIGSIFPSYGFSVANVHPHGHNYHTDVVHPGSGVSFQTHNALVLH